MRAAAVAKDEIPINADYARRLGDLDLTAAQRAELPEYLARIDETPLAHSVKGMYVSGVVAAMRAVKVDCPSQRFHAFKDYPLRDFMALLLEAAATLYPTQTLHDGLRSLGEQAIPSFAESIAGRVVMATVGRSWEMALRMVSRGYEISLKPGKATVAVMERDHAVVRLRNVRNFGESYQVGVVSGLMRWCRLEGSVVPTVLSPGDTDLAISWR